MQKTTHRHTRELDVFYNEHRNACTNCGKEFQNGMRAHLGYNTENTPVVLCDDCAYLLSETVERYNWRELEYEKVMPEAKLWRYMDLSKFLSMIGRKTLYFASAESFEDIFEGAKGILERKGEWDEFYLAFFKKALQSVPGINSEDLTVKHIENNATRLLSEMTAIGEENRKHTFVSCWHHNEYESEAMWKLYSTNVSNALAIQTTYQQLYEALDKDPSIEIGKVKYIDFSKSFASINGPYWYKRKSFEYEREVRAIIRNHHAHDGIEKEVNLEKLISAVYISPYAPKWFKDVVYDVMQKYELNKPLYHSEMLKTPFY